MLKSQWKKIATAVALATLLLLAPSCQSFDFFANAAHNAPAAGEKQGVRSLSDLRLAIDPGHGGVDPGSSGAVTGVHEADLNLSIAKALYAQLRLAGAETALTRDSSSVDYTGSGETQKRKDMNNRIKLVKDQDAQALISIHMNIYSDKSVSGAQVFFQKGSAEGEALARSIQAELNTGINGKKARHIESGEYYLLKGVDCPSAIVECGFLSNRADEKNLQDPDYQKKLADCIYKGICKYFGIQ